VPSQKPDEKFVHVQAAKIEHFHGHKITVVETNYHMRYLKRTSCANPIFIEGFLREPLVKLKSLFSELTTTLIELRLSKFLQRDWVEAK